MKFNMAKTKDIENDFEAPITNSAIAAEHLQIMDETARALAAMPKVRVRLPLPPGISQAEALKMEKPPCEPVCINGYVIQIRRGDSVLVPEEVANVLMRAGLI